VSSLSSRLPRSRADIELAVHHQLRRLRATAMRGPVGRRLHRLFHTELIERSANFSDTTWLGQPIWQNVLDLWTIQETIHAVRPALLIETGTNRGGSSWFYGQLMDLMDHDGRIVTVDVERLYEREHPRVEYLHGSSIAPDVLERMRQAAAQAAGPVMVILDSDHSRDHVAAELEAYAPFVSPDSFMLVQDGVIDELPIFRTSRPGPLPAIHAFLSKHPEFEIDRPRTDRFVITHHPDGWLRRRADGS
jgi:cephalosporin hydroxylase